MVGRHLTNLSQKYGMMENRILQDCNGNAQGLICIKNTLQKTWLVSSFISYILCQNNIE